MSQRTSDTMLGFAAGVMLSAAFVSLIVIAISIHNFPKGLSVGVALIRAVILQNGPSGSRRLPD